MTALWDKLVVGGAWYTTSFPLTHTTVMSESVVVRVNDAAVKEGWRVLEAPPRLVFDVAPTPNAQIVIEYALENAP